MFSQGILHTFTSSVLSEVVFAVSLLLFGTNSCSSVFFVSSCSEVLPLSASFRSSMSLLSQLISLLMFRTESCSFLFFVSSCSIVLTLSISFRSAMPLLSELIGRSSLCVFYQRNKNEPA